MKWKAEWSALSTRDIGMLRAQTRIAIMNNHVVDELLCIFRCFVSISEWLAKPHAILFHQLTDPPETARKVTTTGAGISSKKQSAETHRNDDRNNNRTQQQQGDVASLCLQNRSDRSNNCNLNVFRDFRQSTMLLCEPRICDSMGR